MMKRIIALVAVVAFVLGSIFLAQTIASVNVFVHVNIEVKTSTDDGVQNNEAQMHEKSPPIFYDIIIHSLKCVISFAFGGGLEIHLHLHKKEHN